MFDQLYLERVVTEQYYQENMRRLAFSGANNFRDLGGYRTVNGEAVRWGALYRSDHLHKLTDADLRHLAALSLDRIIDFRAEHEKAEEPDRLPENMGIRVVELPILDSSTETWRDSRDKFVKDNLRNIDPARFMTEANIELATRFTPQMRQFIHELLSANGRPVLFHCAAGKDRTGFAAAIILRILGVSQDVVMEDYLLSNQYYLPAYAWNLSLLRLVKGKRFAEVVKGFLEVRPAYLSAAFETIDCEFGSFEKYIYNGLGLSGKDIEKLRDLYLE